MPTLRAAVAAVAALPALAALAVAKVVMRQRPPLALVLNPLMDAPVVVTGVLPVNQALPASQVTTVNLEALAVPLVLLW